MGGTNILDFISLFSLTGKVFINDIKKVSVNTYSK